MRLPEKPVSQVLGAQVRFLRERLKLTQAETAEALGISQSHLSSIERGLKFPSAVVIESLARVLQVDYYNLFLDQSGLGIAIADLIRGSDGLGDEIVALTRDWISRRTNPSQ